LKRFLASGWDRSDPGPFARGGLDSGLEISFAGLWIVPARLPKSWVDLDRVGVGSSGHMPIDLVKEYFRACLIV